MSIPIGVTRSSMFSQITPEAGSFQGTTKLSGGCRGSDCVWTNETLFDQTASGERCR